MVPYVMYEGTLPAVALYSRCEDELLAKAELLHLARLAHRVRPASMVWAYVDVDPSFTIAEFMAAYGRPRKRRLLMESRAEIIANGWTYPERDVVESA